MLVVLDDDPTGTQAAAGVDVLLDWQAPLAFDPRHAVHVLTNARALDARGARATVEAAARAARRRWPDARAVLRGDSTLRGHVTEEYDAVCAAYGLDAPPLLLVPALPSAGRLTVRGVHVLDGIPLHETEYARDGVFSYATSDLAAWAEARSGGRFRADRARRVQPD